ncbi:OCIA domain-containing protein 1-like [Pseudomyrmex gracilis]|uniref:OCIA domain-containing protein 1-like n=1 Tax=Pseudomyrmex gracilis TaxID=219809 RepID=UPI000994E80E|nr:OCIA domain-containing protein 1-like [Pseudomyrmex gracilis]
MAATVTDVQQPDYGMDRQMQRVSLTPEEIAVFQSCMKNSSIVMPAVVGAVIGYGIFGVTPFRAYAKYSAVIGGMLGFVSSRFVAAKMCIDKVASMPNSTLKDRLAELGYYGRNRFIGERQYQSFQPPNVQSEVRESSSGQIVFDDYPPMTSYDAYSSFNDSSDVRSEETDLTEPINLQQKGVSYDELRHKNREEFYKKNKQWYTPKAPESSPVETKQFSAPAYSPPMQGKTNKYGDVWG